MTHDQRPPIPIHVVGIGLEGAAGLTEPIRQIVEQATLLVGSSRHLSYFPNHPAQRIVFSNFQNTIAQIRHYLSSPTSSSSPSPPPSPLPPPDTQHPTPLITILTSGDPLFFGLGRLLLEEFPAESLVFHPHLSSVQLAFSRVKLPWQDAQFVSAHGRSLDELISALQQGASKIAVLTDSTNSPQAIARLIQSLDLPTRYKLWVCENLGGDNERIWEWDWSQDSVPPIAALNVVILQRLIPAEISLDPTTLPLLGIPDQAFLSFSDRPGLMTKREVRVQVIGELALQPGQIIWDIGAGTGSVSIELARLCPQSQVFAVEKTAIGSTLIEKNCHRFQVSNVTSVHGAAPDALQDLPQPDRIFIGGSGGNLIPILTACEERLAVNGRIVLALATLEHLSQVVTWFGQRVEGRRQKAEGRGQKAELGVGGQVSGGRDDTAKLVELENNIGWSYRVVQVQISRSTAIANLTRLSPLNPVTLVIAEKL